MIPSDRFFYRGKLHKDVFINGKTHKEAKMVVDGNPEVVWKKIAWGDKQRFFGAELENCDYTNNKADLCFYLIEPTQKKSKKTFIERVFFHGNTTVGDSTNLTGIFCCVIEDGTIIVRYGYTDHTMGSPYPKHTLIFASTDGGETFHTLKRHHSQVGTYVISDNGYFFAGDYVDVTGSYSSIIYYKYNETRTGIEEEPKFLLKDEFDPEENPNDKYVINDFLKRSSAAANFKYIPAYLPHDIIPVYMSERFTRSKRFTEFVPRIYNPNGYIELNSFRTIGWNEESAQSTQSYVDNSYYDRNRTCGFSSDEFHYVVAWYDGNRIVLYMISIPISELYLSNHTERLETIQEPIAQIESPYGIYPMDIKAFFNRNTGKERICVKYFMSSSDRIKNIVFNKEDITVKSSTVSSRKASVSYKLLDGTNGYYEISRNEFLGSNICYEPADRALEGVNRFVALGHIGSSTSRHTVYLINEDITFYSSANMKMYEPGGTYA